MEEKSPKQNQPKETILRVKRKRNEGALNTLVLEERAAKQRRNKYLQTVSALASLSIKSALPRRKVFRFFGSDIDSNLSEALSQKDKLKAKPVQLDRQQRLQKKTDCSKISRFSQLNKLRYFSSKEGEKTQEYSLLDLIPSEERHVNALVGNISAVDVIPEIKVHQSDEKMEEWVTDYYYLDEETTFDEKDEVCDIPIIPIESFAYSLNDEILVDEYDEESSLSYDSNNERDYPSTEEDSYREDKSTGESSEDKEDSSDDRDYGYSYDPRDYSQYDPYI